MPFRFAALGAALALAAAAPAAADRVVRDVGLFESFAIEGVTLSMSPRAALEHLLAAGYSAGEITTFSQWEVDGVNLTRGSPVSAQGESWMTLERRGDRLVLISETLNRLAAPRVDPEAEIAAVRGHFAITGDEPFCSYNGHNAGACELADAAEDANLIFSMTAHQTMVLRAISRSAELRLEYGRVMP